MELTMFERLLQLPLFQGMTKKEIADVIEHVRLDFVKYEAGEEIVMQDDPCKSLIYIINGEMSTDYIDVKHKFSLTEDIPNIGVIEPYNMFGMMPRYSRTYIFKTAGTTLAIDKQMLLNHLMSSSIVRINMMNITCNRYHQVLKLMNDFPGNTVGEKITKFVLSYSSVPKGGKELHMKMTDLADIVHETRLNVSKALNAMQDAGLLELQRNKFTIFDIAKLYNRI